MLKVRIQKADNGYVLEVLNEGTSTFKTRYDKPVLVFSKLSLLLEFLEVNFREESEGD